MPLLTEKEEYFFLKYLFRKYLKLVLNSERRLRGKSELVKKRIFLKGFKIF